MVKQHRMTMNTKNNNNGFSRKQVDCSVKVDGLKLENVRKQIYLGVILVRMGEWSVSWSSELVQL